MMTAAQIRQSFLDFFKEKQHTIVPSSSLMPDSPNLLFTNAGMNQFVPIFLGQIECPYKPGRAADTQKCIRAGGKHNDLDDVGLDTYHHTFFEMLGNWSFGDYFKKEAIAWAWELVIERWKFPAERVYATIYQPDKSKNDPAERDQEAWDIWAEKFRSVGLDPDIHIVNGNKKDNFWMMGDTGPCGPCTEIHVDLTPGPVRTDVERQKIGATLVNGPDARCIEIWNNVFIQYNANPDGTFSPLPAQHVDTGMGFERVVSIIHGTKNFTDFENAKISNYDTDVFRPIFDEIEKLSGKKYTSTLPKAGSTGDTEQEKIDIAFRVIADHIRTLSFSIADGIQPGNTDRNYVLRRILRRAVRYGRTLGFTEPFFYKLVDVLAKHMGDVFPEIRVKQQSVIETLKREEEAFNKTLDGGLKIFEDILRIRESAVGFRKTLVGILHIADKADEGAEKALQSISMNVLGAAGRFILNTMGDLDAQISARMLERADLKDLVDSSRAIAEAVEAPGFPTEQKEQGPIAKAAAEFLTAVTHYLEVSSRFQTVFNGEAAFLLYDTFGFPLDLTELLARERGLSVDVAGFNRLMEEQRKRARGAQVREVIALSEIETKEPTEFIGYDHNHNRADVLEVVGVKDRTAVVLNKSVFYAEMGGQVGDTGTLSGGGGRVWNVLNTQKMGNTWLHFIEPSPDAMPVEGMDPSEPPSLHEHLTIALDIPRRRAIERHHTVTHIFHWALHEVVNKEATQKGSYVGPEKLTFDFNSAALTAQQLADVEKLVNEKIVANEPVFWQEFPYAEVKSNANVMQLFGEKYGDKVRVVQIGGRAGQLNGYSMELCGGTHTRGTGEIGLFRIVGEGAVSAGVRRVEAIAGLEAYNVARSEHELIKALANKVTAQGAADLEKKIDALLAHQKELEKTLKAAQQREASGRAKDLLAEASHNAIVANLGAVDGDYVMAVNDALKSLFKGVIVLGSATNGAVVLTASVDKEFQGKLQAGKIIQTIAPIVGGKGGGKPDFARGGGKDSAKLDQALAEARKMCNF